MQTRTAFALLFLSALHVGCSSSSSSGAAPSAAPHAVVASIKLSLDADGMNVGFPTMNGALAVRDETRSHAGGHTDPDWSATPVT